MFDAGIALTPLAAGETPAVPGGRSITVRLDLLNCDCPNTYRKLEIGPPAPARARITVGVIPGLSRDASAP